MEGVQLGGRKEDTGLLVIRDKLTARRTGSPQGHRSRIASALEADPLL